MPPVEVWSAAASNIGLGAGVLLIAALLIIHGHKYITAWAELRKTRRDQGSSDDDRRDTKVTG